ncbi:(d)CMP kinase [Calditerrivibrio nitroreducens]|uniref:Cytidylate kinase n=1 Tax=Calditerrivibrio nitroreducens (strain DSM 19672 / NBRC 101217 / Yu37-1) TaxID=768670 RepID=E4TIQ3_CALNY|nr:(d)CMP kinase [Calditerrivibrio nitroreducens]ADR18008.1 cytidylate kinase [Calditerrivibrio nitroreducens DSM 19672]
MLRIAIDGPAGSGKSTISKRLAEKYNLLYIDTGAFYRTAAWMLVKFNLSVGELANYLKRCRIMLEKDRVLIDLDGNIYDVTDEIRSPDISMKTSEIAAIPEVRSVITDQQKAVAKRSSVVMDGRDIGTVVIPDAEIKIFLTASANERAKRRYNELIGKGLDVDFDTLLGEIVERDKNDANRSVAPLKKADDAYELDTTDMSIDEVVSEIEKIIRKKGF